MIDIRTERLIPLREVPGYLESRGLGERVTVRMVRGWTTRGYGGLRLESILVGRWKVTSEEAIQRWVEARTRAAVPAPASPDSPSMSPARMTAEQARRGEETDRFLIEHRVMPSELDRAIRNLSVGEASTRDHIAGVLFRAGFRRPNEIRRRSLDGLLSLPGIGPRSEPVVKALWESVAMPADSPGWKPGPVGQETSEAGGTDCSVRSQGKHPHGRAARTEARHERLDDIGR